MRYRTACYRMVRRLANKLAHSLHKARYTHARRLQSHIDRRKPAHKVHGKLLRAPHKLVLRKLQDHIRPRRNLAQHRNQPSTLSCSLRHPKRSRSGMDHCIHLDANDGDDDAESQLQIYWCLSTVHLPLTSLGLRN